MDEFQPRAVLVTGGAGFIASHVVIKLMQRFPNCKVRARQNLTRRTRLYIRASRDRSPNFWVRDAALTACTSTSGGGPGQARLLRHPEQPRLRPRLPQLPLRQGRHPELRPGGARPPGRGHRRGDAFCGANARGQLVWQLAGLHAEQHPRHARPAGGVPPLRSPAALRQRLYRRGVRGDEPGPRRGAHRGVAPGAHQPLLGRQGGRGDDGPRVPHLVPPARHHHPRQQRVRAPPVPGKGGRLVPARRRRRLLSLAALLHRTNLPPSHSARPRR
jgi:hypothetical protein